MFVGYKFSENWQKWKFYHEIVEYHQNAKFYQQGYMVHVFMIVNSLYVHSGNTQYIYSLIYMYM